MDIDQVPQDDSNILEGKSKVLKYAIGKDGKYTCVPTVGWEPENIVLNQAWEDINEKAAIIKQLVIKGEVSPIAYFMEKKMFDLKMLADQIGSWQFLVKRHLKPRVFKRLNNRQIEEYASAFQISVDDLINFK